MPLAVSENRIARAEGPEQEPREQAICPPVRTLRAGRLTWRPGGFFPGHVGPGAPVGLARPNRRKQRGRRGSFLVGGSPRIPARRARC